jgi:hypothetical protein
VRLPTFASTLLVVALPFATASLPDTLTVSTSACIALGGIAGLTRPDIGARRVLENIALGAGTGGVIGALIGFVIYAVGRLAGSA